jgi:hypothetical protein
MRGSRPREIKSSQRVSLSLSLSRSYSLTRTLSYLFHARLIPVCLLCAYQ